MQYDTVSTVRVATKYFLNKKLRAYIIMKFYFF